MKSTGIYVVSGGNAGTSVANHGLRALRTDCERLVVVTSPDSDLQWLEKFAPDEILFDEHVEASFLAGLRRGLIAELSGDPDPETCIVATGAHVLSPIGELSSLLERVRSEGIDLFAPYWCNSHLDPRTKRLNAPQFIPYLDFAIFSPRLLAETTFLNFWQKVSGQDFLNDLFDILVPFARLLAAHAVSATYPFKPDDLETSDPRLYEVDRLIGGNSPALPLAVLSVDPLLHDINAISLRPALDTLRARDPAAYQALIGYATKSIPMREFNANADQFEILPLSAECPDKRIWSFGSVAVFIHAYYPEMIEELVGIAERIPAPFDLFVSTASAQNRQKIEEFLTSAGYQSNQFDIRVVAQNRGRDMSSLFITFRDVILSDKYEIALRLHSKRTPQVSPQVSAEFKTHLFENLAPNSGYVSNLLNKLEKEPDIGLVIPPVIHIGFATLGHSWFNNFDMVKKLCSELGLSVPLDTSTPVAPNGTMFWFRTAALRKLFEHPWTWESYNKEPNHIDGGLAHAQERLIGYCAQAAGFRVLNVMNPKSAARNYAKLEYKLQRLAAHLPTGNIVEQDAILSRSKKSFRNQTHKKLKEIYGRILVRWPASRRFIRPIAKTVQRALS